MGLVPRRIQHLDLAELRGEDAVRLRYVLLDKLWKKPQGLICVFRRRSHFAASRAPWLCEVLARQVTPGHLPASRAAYCVTKMSRHGRSPRSKSRFPFPLIVMGKNWGNPSAWGLLFCVLFLRGPLHAQLRIVDYNTAVTRPVHVPACRPCRAIGSESVNGIAKPIDVARPPGTARQRRDHPGHRRHPSSVSMVPAPMPWPRPIPSSDSTGTPALIYNTPDGSTRRPDDGLHRGQQWRRPSHWAL